MVEITTYRRGVSGADGNILYFDDAEGRAQFEALEAAWKSYCTTGQPVIHEAQLPSTPGSRWLIRLEGIEEIGFWVHNDAKFEYETQRLIWIERQQKEIQKAVSDGLKSGVGFKTENL